MTQNALGILCVFGGPRPGPEQFRRWWIIVCRLWRLFIRAVMVTSDLNNKIVQNANLQSGAASPPRHFCCKNLPCCAAKMPRSKASPESLIKLQIAYLALLRGAAARRHTLLLVRVRGPRPFRAAPSRGFRSFSPSSRS